LRFSIDIDVILEYEEKENLSKRLGELVQNSQFFENSEPDIREGEIPKEHYKFYYHSLFTDKEEYVLLDVIFCANPYYRVLQKSLADLPLPSVDQILKVKIPTPEGLLADKMTAISPKTIGIPLNEEREMEFVKQVVDIGLLFNLVDDLGNAVITFDKISEIENGFRKSNYSRLEILDSILDVSFKYCQYQLKGADNKFTEIECLNRGLRKVGNHLVGRYSQNNLKTSFSKVAYMCKVIKRRGNFTFKKEVDSKMVEDKRLKGKFGILELLRKTNLDAYFYWMSGYGE